MKRRVKINSGVYGFLLTRGVLEKGTDQEIQNARREYWKEYKRKWRNEKRKTEKELTASFNSEELKLLTQEAKRHKMSRTQFMKQTSLAYISKNYIVPNIYEVKQIAQLLSMTYNSMQDLVDENKVSSNIGRNSLEIIYQLEREILPILHNPKTIEEYIKKYIGKDTENKSRLLELINSL